MPVQHPPLSSSPLSSSVVASPSAGSHEPSRRAALGALGVAAIPLAAIPSLAATPLRVWVGTYTREDSKGIYTMQFDPAAGKLTPPQLAAEIANPSFLAVHPNGRFLYSVGELGEFEGQRSGAVHAFAIDRDTGKLRLLNSAAAGGTSTCHLAVDAAGGSLAAVNYGTGSAAVFRLKADGSLGERSGYVQHQGSSANEQRQKGPHAHSVNWSKNNRWAVVADLGIDEFIVYAFDAAKGTITRSSAAKVEPGSGPRHFAFHPGFRFAYGLNEMGSTVSVFRWDERRGQLGEVQMVSTLPAGFAGENSCAEILVHRTGRFVYASNRGHNSLAVFAADPASGQLTPVDHTPTQGQVPRNFRIDPSGNWLIAANQNSANLVVFRIDPSTGKLSANGETARVAFPVCVKFL